MLISNYVTWLASTHYNYERLTSARYRNSVLVSVILSSAKVSVGESEVCICGLGIFQPKHVMFTLLDSNLQMRAHSQPILRA